MGTEEMKRIAKCIGMTARDFEGTAALVKAEVADMCEKFPLYR
jgi:glycine hydroxymethyltransferase